MTRQIHDQFAKEYLEELLTPLGTIRKSKKVKSEVQEIDVWFEPFSSPTPTELRLAKSMNNLPRNIWRNYLPL